jgi:hypothetical protein
MNARRPAHARRKDALYRRVQRIRLDQIADGSMQPRYPREQYFLWTLQARGRVRYDDFIVSGLLFLAEMEIAKMDEASADEPPALTAS